MTNQPNPKRSARKAEKPRDRIMCPDCNGQGRHFLRYRMGLPAEEMERHRCKGYGFIQLD